LTYRQKFTLDNALQLYTVLLSFVSLLGKKHWASVASRHTTQIYLLAFVIYAYRDLWPLATFTLIPKDGSEGTFLWVKIALLFLSGVVIPLFFPQEYIPFDPKVALSPKVF
jgi:hypothetical protein